MGNVAESVQANQQLHAFCNKQINHSFSNQTIQNEFPLSQLKKERYWPIVASKNLMNQSARQKLKMNEQTKQNQEGFNLESIRLRISQDLIMPVFQALGRVKFKKPTFQMIKIENKRFLKMKTTPITKDYQFCKEIGKGGFGAVYKAKDKKNNEVRAIKKINKNALTADERYSLANQFDILSSLDHPSIIKLYDIYDDESYFYVVTELCEGGDLLHFVNERVLTEKMMRSIMVQLMSAVKYMHNLQILHRDIKLENLVLVKKVTSQHQKIEIKLIDFGISINMNKVLPSDIDNAGTLIYMPPECFTHDVQTLAFDIWSCGIALYMMSTRKRPYKFKNDNELMQRIKNGDLIRSNVQRLSFDLKVFIMVLLEQNHSNRINAARALNNIWLKKQPEKSSITVSVRFKAAKNLLDYDAKNNLVSIIQAYLIYKKVSQEQRQRLASIFGQIDEDKSGVIEIEELKKFYCQNSQHYDCEDVQQLLNSMDKNKSGKIDFNQFITAMCDRRELFQRQALEEAFDYFDKDKSGEISKKQLESILTGIQRQEIQYLFSQLDKNNDYKISRKQFISYLSNAKSL